MRRIAAALGVLAVLLTGVFELVATLELIRDRHYLLGEVVNGQAIVHIDGIVAQANRRRAGRAEERLMIRVTGQPRWLVLRDVTTREIDAIRPGSRIRATAYPLRPSAWLQRRFLREHGLFVLGIDVGGTTLRDGDDGIASLGRNSLLQIGFLALVSLLTFTAAWIMATVLLRRRQV